MASAPRAAAAPPRPLGIGLHTAAALHAQPGLAVTGGADAGLELRLGPAWLSAGGAAYTAVELPGGQLGLARLHGFVGASTAPAPGWTLSGGLGGAALRWDIADQRGQRESWAPALGGRVELAGALSGPLSLRMGVDGLAHLRELRFDSAAAQAETFSLSALLGLHLELKGRPE